MVVPGLEQVLDSIGMMIGVLAFCLILIVTDGG